MKINPSVGFEHYKKTVNAVKNGEYAGASAGKSVFDAVLTQAVAENTDKVMISENASAHAELIRFTSVLSAEADTQVDALKIDELRTAVQSGTYNVPAAAIADAILGMSK